MKYMYEVVYRSKFVYPMFTVVWVLVFIAEHRLDYEHRIWRWLAMCKNIGLYSFIEGSRSGPHFGR